MTDSTTQAIKRFIEERRAIEAKATEGPWFMHDDEVGVIRDEEIAKVVCNVHRIPMDGNSAFIIDSRQAVPVLLAMVEECVKALEFYSADKSYDFEINLACDRASGVMLDDSGKLARDALRKVAKLASGGG